MSIGECGSAWSAGMGYALAVWWPPFMGSFALLIRMVQPSKAVVILSIVMSIVFLTLGIGCFFVACAGAWVASLGNTERFTTTGIFGSRKPAGMEERENLSVVIAPSASRSVSAAGVTHFLWTCLRSLL